MNVALFQAEDLNEGHWHIPVARCNENLCLVEAYDNPHLQPAVVMKKLNEAQVGTNNIILVVVMLVVVVVVVVVVILVVIVVVISGGGGGGGGVVSSKNNLYTASVGCAAAADLSMTEHVWWNNADMCFRLKTGVNVSLLHVVKRICLSLKLTMTQVCSL